MHLLQLRLARNLASHGSANLILALLQMAILATFARTLSVSVLADYILAVASIALFEVVSDFGARHWAIRELSKHDTRDCFHQTLKLKALFSGLALIAGIVTLLATKQSVLTSILIVLIAITQSASDPMLWRLRALQHMQYEAQILVLNRLMISCGVIVSGVYFASITGMLCVWLSCNLLRIIYELSQSASICRWPAYPVSEPDRNDARIQTASRANLATLASATLWIGFSVTTYALYYRIGILYLEQTNSDSVIATFGLFFSLASAATIASNTLANVYYPRVSRAVVGNDVLEISKQLRQLLSIFGVLFICGGTLGVFVADWVVKVYAGDNYAGTDYLLHLIPWIYLTGLASCLRMALLAISQERFELIVNVISLALILTCFQLLPQELSPIDRVIAAYTVSELAVCALRIIRLRYHGSCPTNIWFVLAGAGLLGLLVLL